jgi:tetratricopeptide (TPR) repeat protein
MLKNRFLFLKNRATLQKKESMKMSPNEAIEVIKKERAINIPTVEQFVSEKLKELYLDQGYTNKSKVFELIEFCFNSNNKFPVNGTADQYYDLSVTLAKDSLFNLACFVLEAGLREYPKEVDIMACLLKCGVSSSDRRSQCPKYYNALKKIPKNRWTGRTYVFSIDYLLAYQTIEKDGNFDEEIENLISDFKLRFSNDERPYLAHADYYQSIQQFDKEQELLETAIKNVDVPSRCSFRLAKIYFTKGIYKCAMELLDNCETYLCQRNSGGLDISNVYAQHAFCGIAVYFSDNFLDKEDKIALAKQIFSDYRKTRIADPSNSQLFIQLSKLKDIISEDSGVLSSD